MSKTNFNVRTRFAPSPSGKLHIGGARTALFNYLLSKKNNGSFILRIENTNTNKSNEKLILDLYNDLKWLGITPDESPFNEKKEFGPYEQKKRLNIYKKHLENLLVSKKAYCCFCSSEEIEKEKEEYIKLNKKHNYQYSRKCLFLSKKEIDQKLKIQEYYVIRFLVDKTQNYNFEDLIRGTIVTKGEDMEDFIICRNNGFPLYNFAAAVDDHLMKITHVIRGEDHITNTGKQLAIFRAFQWDIPFFAHIPIVLNTENKKISKREKETNNLHYIDELQSKGYLPEAIINHLLFLGWHPGITEEFFSIEQAINLFNTDGLQKSNAVFDINKLNWYNRYYIKKLSNEEFIHHSWNFLGNVKNLIDFTEQEINNISLLFREHINCFQDLEQLTRFFFETNKKTIKVTKEEFEIIKKLQLEIKKNEKWNIPTIKNIFEKVINFKQTNCSKKTLFPLIREILTENKQGIHLAEIIYYLGKKKTYERLNLIFIQ